MKILNTKANKYDHMKGRYEEYDQKIESAVTLLREVQKALNPVSNISRAYGKRQDRSAVLEEAYNAMKMGQEVGNAFFNKRGYEPTTTANLMAKVGKMVGVDKRKEGRTAFYFLRKEI